MTNTNNSHTPICDFVREYSSSEYSRFHMPGHKGITYSENSETNLPYILDITEIKGADSLYEASGIIAKSEQIASDLFGTSATFFSTEGSSQCIRAMIALATKWSSRKADERQIILAARNVHRAFITAAALLDLDVEWLYSQDESYTLCSCPISSEQVRNTLTNMKQLPAAIYLTSPDYLGNLQDISGIAAVAHEFGIPLLVDNAHGAYLKFLEPSIHPIDLGADMCCDSAHKTLPALTGCAYLHINKNALADYSVNAKKALSIFGSTSPSYILLQSLDQVNKFLADDFSSRLKYCIMYISQTKSVLRLLGWNIHGISDITGYCTDDEPMKITIYSHSYGYSGFELAEELRKYNIECEYADPDFLVLMPSINTPAGDYQKLIDVMTKLRRKMSSLTVNDMLCPKPERFCSIRDAFFADTKTLTIEESIGHICADTAISCPPAVPLLVSGELITQDMLPLLKHYNISHISVIK